MTRKDATPDTREVVNCVADLACVTLKRGYAGVLLLIDELGKLFEYAAHRPHKSDMFVLQELAEHASRSADSPVLMLGLLHQSFEEYGRHLDSVSRTEWSKIQGRFQDIAFLEPPEQVIRMIATAIKWKSGDMPARLRRQVTDIAELAATTGICPNGMKRDEFVDVCIKAYPLHPVALVSLPYLFHRFAQNERSLFSYLSSHEPRGFQEFLRTHARNTTSPEFIRLHDLFDYFIANFGSGLFRQPQARRWLEAAEILERKNDLTDLHSQLVKTVGMLSTLGSFCHLGATQSAIAFAAGDSASCREVASGLKSLTERSILNYRRFNDTYRIWEGSDVDIEERIREGERRIRTDLRLADSIQHYLPARPVVARRHSFETGSLRYFQMRYVDAPLELAGTPTIEAGASGLITVCLSSSGGQLEEFKRSAASATTANPSILLAVPQEIGELRAMVAELAALRWAWENTPELRDDRVARRELASRLADTQQLLTKRLNRLLDPREEPAGSQCCWYYMGERKKVRTPVQVSHLLSDVCDQLYAQCPRIQNELIARRTLSSAAAAAQRNLLERMLTTADKENLGLEGYPPERSMYESVLKATGLHRRQSQGTWRFAGPTATDPCRLRPVWQKLHELVFQARPTPLPLESLSQAIARPPYGVPDGLHPVLLCAFLAAHSTEVTLYREGTFIPEPGITDFEVLQRRPEFFAVGGCRLVGGRAAVVQRIAKGLAVEPATAPVVRALFRMVKGLPEFARSTMSLSAQTQAMRQAFVNARSPDTFLFVELPTSLGLAPFEEGRSARHHIDEFFVGLNRALQEWSNALPLVVNTARDVLLEACGFAAGLQGWISLKDRAHDLEPGLAHPTLLPFVRRIAQSDTDSKTVESVLALVASRPPKTWTDDDVKRFPGLAEVMGRLFREAACASTSIPRTPTLRH